MSFYPLDLTKVLNHKLVYDRNLKDKTEYGLDNVYVLKEDYNVKNEEIINGVNFKFYNGIFDNVVCENQELEINKKTKSLNIIGFSYWGDTFDNFILEFMNETKEKITVALPDWSHSINNMYWSTKSSLTNYNINTVKTFKSSGRQILDLYLHQFKVKLDNNKEIKKIIFPDNMFMHIFAITIEE